VGDVEEREKDQNKVQMREEKPSSLACKTSAGEEDGTQCHNLFMGYSLNSLIFLPK
jgi:hypothetical protein